MCQTDYASCCFFSEMLMKKIGSAAGLPAGIMRKEWVCTHSFSKAYLHFNSSKRIISQNKSLYKTSSTVFMVFFARFHQKNREKGF